MERIFTLIVKTILQVLSSGKKANPKPQPEPEEKAPCCPIPEPEPEEKKVTHQKRYLWLLDNGHGETTPGKRSPIFDDGRQLFEYEFNRAVVTRMGGLWNPSRRAPE